MNCAPARRSRSSSAGLLAVVLRERNRAPAATQFKPPAPVRQNEERARWNDRLDVLRHEPAERRAVLGVCLIMPNVRAVVNGVSLFE